MVDRLGVEPNGSRCQTSIGSHCLAREWGTYHAWKAGKAYEDIAGFCKSTKLDEIKSHGYVLTPGRYVGAAEVEEDDEPFAEKMQRLTTELGEQFAESAKLEAAIRENLNSLGFAAKSWL
ncbi:N-6 DNA methylase [Aeoliella sp. ICT_H6.2]|uniref:N-6 DNA methylase n=1 Tax=Aeoliella straminimaris TaxID=2954799 RepID=A0A9X2F7H1_9BACT|nr:N-6 DNA methylase [Aeoliella straminimaris]MCO6043058.1 N-6 DNA methylase [Aeoliella straminimaris]